MTFVQRKISVQITLQNGNFSNGGNTKTIAAQDTPSGVDTNAPRISARINAAGGVFGSQMSIAIWGLPLSDMNQLSTVGKQLTYMSANNKITVNAGDGTNANLPLLFSGRISFAYVDAAAPPNVCLRLTATPGAALNTQNNDSISIGGVGDFDTIGRQLATAGGFDFENNNVTAKFATPYLWGSVGDQIKQLIKAAGVEHILDLNTFAVWNPGSYRTALAPITLAPPQLKGYPKFSQACVDCESIFNPAFRIGGKFNLQTSLTPAAGVWATQSVHHDVEANMPGGKWFTAIRGVGIQSGTTP